MKLFTNKERKQLLENFISNTARVKAWVETIDYPPVVRFVCLNYTILLSELDIAENRASGLASLWNEFCKIIRMSLDVLYDVRLPTVDCNNNPSSIWFVKDFSFKPHKPLLQYLWKWEINYD